MTAVMARPAPKPRFHWRAGLPGDGDGTPPGELTYGGYLKVETDAGIVTPSVIMLRISIALRREHYDLLCQARCGRLSAEYANKLGWLSGNLYSRIATPDWEDQEHDKDASAKLAKAYLNRITQPGP